MVKNAFRTLGSRSAERSSTTIIPCLAFDIATVFRWSFITNDEYNSDLVLLVIITEKSHSQPWH